MDLTILLEEWELPAKYVTKFLEENVDVETLHHLVEDDLSILIPEIGARAKFRTKWKQWKQENKIFQSTPSASTESNTTPSLFDSEDLDDAIETMENIVNEKTLTDTESKSDAVKHNSLYKLLEKDKALKYLLSLKKLTKPQRSVVAKAVVSHLVQITPSGLIKPGTLQEWANFAVQVFPEEDITFYFYSVAPLSATSSTRARSVPSPTRRYYGVFWDRWNNYRKILRESNSIPYKKREKPIQSRNISECSSTTNPDPDIEISLKLIEAFQEPDTTDYLLDAWGKTMTERFNILRKQLSTTDYLKQFPVLRNQTIATKLIDRDFKKSSSSTASVSLAIEIKKYDKNIIQLAREKVAAFKDQKQKENVNNILHLYDSGKEGNQDLTAALLVLPYLFSSGGKVGNRGGRASRAEASRAFVLLSSSLAEAEQAVEERKNIPKGKNLKLQPFIIAIGTTWANVTSAYVFIDEPLYRFNNILDAIDLCFKAFFAFDLEYPLECEHVWLLLQKAFYNITLPNDKIILNVNQIISSLKTRDTTT